MRKYISKQTIVVFIVAFLLGGIMFSVAPVQAAIEEYICYKASYKVMVDGVEFTDQTKPILNYNGYTYYPKEVLEKAGLNVTWNTMLNQEEITSNPTSEQIKNVEVNTMSANTTIEYDPITGLPVGAELVMRDKNGISYKTIEYNNKTYISESGLKIYGFVYVSGGTFRNRTTGETVSINSFKENALSVDGTMYFDIRLFANKIGE